MKIIALVLATLALSTQAQAEVLKCWDFYSPKGAAPSLTASILSDSSLDNVKILSDEYNWGYLKAPAGRIDGTVIETKHSPYHDLQEFSLENARLILPPRLDAQSLTEALKNGATGKNENGVIIGSFPFSDGAGNHFSLRLRCRAYSN